MTNRVKYVSIVDGTRIIVAFTDGLIETFTANPLLNGLNGEEVIYKPIDENDPNLMQCCSCEKIFTELTINETCPFCSSGNWVKGYIDDPEPRRDDND